MENKNNFKVTLKGAHEFNGKTEMVNKDYEGQLALVITLREDEKSIVSEGAIVGGVYADAPELLLKVIRDMIGEKDFTEACAVVAIEGLAKRLEADAEAAEAEKAAEEKLNGVAESEDDIGQTPYGEDDDDE